MKKYLFAGLLLAQATLHAQTQVGVSGGLTLSNLFENKYHLNTSTRLASYGGLSTDFFVNRHITISPELLYYSKGYRYEITFTDMYGNAVGTTSNATKYDYVVLPLVAKFTGVGKKFAYVGAGVVPGFLLSARQEYPHPYETGQVETRENDFTSTVKRFDMSACISAGIGLRLGEKWLMTTDLKFMPSLNKISVVHLLQDFFVQHKSMSLGLSIKYVLGAPSA